MKILEKLLLIFVFSGLFLSVGFAQKFVPISKGVKSVEITLDEETFVIMRNQSKKNKISALYETTFRGIPQPIILAKGVETLGELEFIEYMKKAQKNEKILIVDSRTPGWYERLRIPGAINIPFTNFTTKEEAIEAMEDNLDVKVNDDGSLDFSKAKTIVAYCNGYWCGQTPGMVKNAKFSLLKMKYPASKIKYYRGGMQAWTSMGFTVVGSGL